MLAERKKKVKWTLNPRGNSWSKDTNKFGQRMLEKMGWKSGEGLGINKQGITEHIKVAYKNDNKCLGYKENGEEWVAHQSHFENLLVELSNSHSTAAVLDSSKDNDSQTGSLEERSRHSRTRVHYQKFTRGKDLSRYSEKDLKCILGQQKANKTDEDNEDYGGNNEHISGFYGVKTINSGSMSDYFKKFTNLKNSSEDHSSDAQFVERELRHMTSEGEEQSDMILKKMKKEKSEELLSVMEDCNFVDSNVTSSLKQLDIKKYGPLEHSEISNEHNDDHTYTDLPKKKHKRHDITDEDHIKTCVSSEELCCDKMYKEKKSKKRKNGSIQDSECAVIEEANKVENMHANKKSKKKHSQLASEDKETSCVQAECVSHESKDIGEHLSFVAVDEVDGKQVKKKSKKKKHGLSSEAEETLFVATEEISHSLVNSEDAGEDLIIEVNDVIEDEQVKKNSKKKKHDSPNEDGDALVVPVECASHIFENSVDSGVQLTFEVDNEIEGKKVKKKSKKKKHEVSSGDAETSAESVSHILLKTKDPGKQTLVFEDDEIQAKHVKKKSKKKKHDSSNEHVETSFMLAEENSEDTTKVTAKEFAKSTKVNDVSSENDVMARDFHKLQCGTNSECVIKSNEQITEDMMPTKRKKRKNSEQGYVENAIVEDTPENEMSIKKKRKRKHKREEDEHKDDGYSEMPEFVKEQKEKALKTNAVEELHSLVNNAISDSHPVVSENVTEKLNEGCLETPAESLERYSSDEIKSLKASVFAQLVNPKLVEFEGSNLHMIAGYGNW